MAGYDHEKLMAGVWAAWDRVQNRPWESNVEPLQMSEHCWYVGDTWVGVILIDSGDGLILIDAGMTGQLYLIFEGIRSLGFDPKNIKKVLLSHGHYDHCAAMKAVLEYTKAEFWAPKEDLDAIRGASDALCARGEFYAPCEPDCFFNDDVSITLGNVSILPMHTPGHTPGTTSFFFEDKTKDGVRVRIGVLGGVGLNTLIPDEPTEDMTPFLQRRCDYRRSMERLKKERVDIAMSSHPAAISALERRQEIREGYNPYLDPQIWDDTVEKYLNRLDQIEGKNLHAH